MRTQLLSVFALCAASLAQQPEAPAPGPAEEGGWRKTAEPAKPGSYVVAPGTRIPLSLINSVSTKHSGEGDRVYLQTAFPIVIDGRVVIPPGSYVAGTITQVKRPGRVKGRGEMFLRFDSLTLPNGVTRDFRARLGSLDGRSSETLDKKEGAIQSDTNKGGDLQTIGEAAGAGASVGVIAGGAANGHYGMGAGIGAAAGAAAGLLGVLLTRGPDIVLARGSTVEMVLDRPLTFERPELDFGNAMPPFQAGDAGGATQKQERRGVPMPGRRWPL